MDFMVAIGLDLTAVAIVIYCARAAAKKGFLRTVIQMVAYVAILLAASFLSRAAAPVIYDRIVEPMLLQDIRQELDSDQYKANAALISVAPHGMLSMADDVIDSLNLEELLNGMNPEQYAEDLIDDLAQATLRPLMISAISAISFVVLFAVLSLVANVLLSALGIINYLPVVGFFNALLGCAVGLLQGALMVYILAVLLQGMLHLYPQGWWIFNQSVIDQSFLFKYFVDPNLLRQLGI